MSSGKEQPKRELDRFLIAMRRPDEPWHLSVTVNLDVGGLREPLCEIQADRKETREYLLREPSFKYPALFEFDKLSESYEQDDAERYSARMTANPDPTPICVRRDWLLAWRAENPDAKHIELLIEALAPDGTDTDATPQTVARMFIVFVFDKQQPAPPKLAFAQAGQPREAGDYEVIRRLSLNFDPDYRYKNDIELSLAERSGAVTSLALLQPSGERVSQADAAEEAGPDHVIRADDLNRTGGAVTIDVGVLRSALRDEPGRIEVDLDVTWCPEDPHQPQHPQFAQRGFSIELPKRQGSYRFAFRREVQWQDDPEAAAFKDIVMWWRGKRLSNRGEACALEVGCSSKETMSREVHFKVCGADDAVLHEGDFHVDGEGPLQIDLEALAARPGFDDWGKSASTIFSGTAAGEDGNTQPWKAVLHWRVEVDLPKMLICVDFGTSATAIVLDMDGSTEPLALGQWLAGVDRDHDERDEKNLIPSHLGISSTRHHRSWFDPASLGDLTFVGGSRAAVGGRLKKFGLTYDVSIPSTFALQQETPADLSPASDQVLTRADDFAASTIWNLKTKLLCNRNTQKFPNSTLTWNGNELISAFDGDVDDLLHDYFSELGRYVTLRAIEETPEPLAREFLALPPADIGVVLTHPAGLLSRHLDSYRKAGKAFLAAITGEEINESLDNRVFLVSEALAAIKCREKGASLSAMPSKQKKELPIYAVIDIGAGTFDVAVLQPPSDLMPQWVLQTDFSFQAAGNLLDRRLAAYVGEILSLEVVKTVLTLPAPLPTRLAEVNRYPDRKTRARGFEYLRAIKSAKVALSKAAKKNATDKLNKGEFYVWPDGQDLVIQLYNTNVDDTSAVSPAEPVPTLVAAGRIDVIPGLATLVVARGPAGVDSIELQLSSMLFRRRQVLAKVGDAKPAGEKYFEALELFGDTLPEYVKEQAGQLGPKVQFILTGRTTLWPPLFEMLWSKLYADQNPEILWHDGDPAEMKLSVVEGAARVVRGEKNEPVVSAPIHAAIAYENKIIYLKLAEYREPKRLSGIFGRAELVNALPALDGGVGAKLLDAMTTLGKDPADTQDGATIAPYVMLEEIRVGADAKISLNWSAGVTHCVLFNGDSPVGSWQLRRRCA